MESPFIKLKHWPQSQHTSHFEAIVTTICWAFSKPFQLQELYLHDIWVLNRWWLNIKKSKHRSKICFVRLSTIKSAVQTPCSMVQIQYTFTVLFYRLVCGIVKIAKVFSKMNTDFIVNVLVVQKSIYLTLSSMLFVVSTQIVLAQCWKTEYLSVKSRKSNTSLLLTK